MKRTLNSFGLCRFLIFILAAVGTVSCAFSASADGKVGYRKLVKNGSGGPSWIGNFLTQKRQVQRVFAPSSNLLWVLGKYYVNWCVPTDKHCEEVSTFIDIAGRKMGVTYSSQGLCRESKENCLNFCNCLRNYYAFLNECGYRRDKCSDRGQSVGKLDGLIRAITSVRDEDWFSESETGVSTKLGVDQEVRNLIKYEDFHTEPLALFDKQEDLVTSPKESLEIRSYWMACQNCRPFLRNFFSTIESLSHVYFYYFY